MKNLAVLFAVVVSLALQAPGRAADLLARENLVAWCIVPFDAAKRGPEERAAMLEKLGIKRFAYDYRAEHIPTWDAELDALKKHGIELTAWWFRTTMNDEAKTTLELFKKHGVKPQLWVNGGGGDPKKTPEEQAALVESEAKRIGEIARAAAAQGLKVALYNHGSWYGEPENQLAIIERLQRNGITNVGIVYNLHHGHEHLDRFPELLAKMKPHLLALNLNGMTRSGAKIIPLAQGELDLELLKIIRESGWSGPVGILNHTDADAEERLRDNLEGLDWLVAKLDGKPAGEKPVPRSWKKPGVALPVPPTAAPASGSRAEASLAPVFGKALANGMVVEGKAEYRELPLTIECRAKLNSARGYNILVANDPKKSAAHWELYTHSRDGMLALYQPGRGGDVRSDVNICDGQWHTLAAVLEPERTRLYVDGKLVKEVPRTPLKGEPVSGGLAFGRLVEGNIGCDGLIDDVRLSKGAREISAPSDAPLKQDAQTVGLWHFDELTAQAPQFAPPANGPDACTILAAKPEELTKTNGWPKADDFRKWDRSLGGPTSNRFSALTQIDKSNVAKLEVAWTYRSGDAKGNIQCNPIVVDGVMFAPTPGGHLVAIEAATGKELWRHLPQPKGKRLQDAVARRGLLFWPGDAQNAARIVFGVGDWICALDPKTGKSIASFGKEGRVELPTGATAVGAVYRHVFVVPGYLGDVFGYDIRTGARLWTFNTKPGPGEPGGETWSRVEQGANCWGGMALDESRGIAYIGLGSPKPNFFGVGHLGDNLFSNCVLALDALTGKRLWHFQEVRHDVWDWDIPAPPNLVTVERHGVKVDAVAQVTKLGNTLLLDRLTGLPLYDFPLRQAGNRVLPGDVAAPLQPFVELPQPFARQAFTLADVTQRTPEANAAAMLVAQRANLGPYPSLDEAKPTLMFNIHGGAEWTGAAADPRGRLYVTANEIPWFITCYRDDDPEPAKPQTAGEQVYMSICFACHGADRKGIGHAPPLRGLRHRVTDEQIREQLKNGRGSMPPMPQITDEQMKPLLDFLMCRDRPIAPVDPQAPVKWTFGGWNRLVDPEGYPGSTPPWGTLTCLDLNTGKIAWQKPLGEYDELAAKGGPKTGQENFGGAMVTASGLVFVSGTRDKKIRAFDADTGAELWSHQLAFHGTAPPATYEVGGRQFVVLPATGGGKLGGPADDAWVAFALPARNGPPTARR
jgi:glucose dehydrogenase/sugar phosphate isomerase/epimerase